VLSGGQAAGGHNVIMGVFDMIKKMNPESRLFGFLMGPHGVYSNNYIEIDHAYMELYRNMGGFDMICKYRTFYFISKNILFPIPHH
jgi:6-phosphofructokinase